MKRLLARLLEMLNFNGRDCTVFLLSLLLAFSIWLIHNLSLDYSDFLSVPLQAECNITGHSSLSANTCEVVARCRTSGYNIIKSRMFGGKTPERIRLERSALHLKSGEIYYMTAKEMNEYAHVIYGEKVNVEYFISDTLFFRFPFENHKKVPVHPVAMLSFEPQYMSAGGLAVEPDSVTLYGEPYHLDNIDMVFTETIKLNGLKAGTAGVARLERIKGLRMSDESVHYTIDVSRFVEMTTEVTLQSRNVPADKEMMIYPSKAELVLRCVFPLVSDVSQVEFYIDYNDFASSMSGKCLACPGNLPDGVLDYELKPEVFECVVTEK